jgi:hypothetical protein
MMTTFKADGASFLGAFGSPPGWYWYLPSPPPSFHGSLSAALETWRSDEALVGDRAARCELVSFWGSPDAIVHNSEAL